MENNEFMSISEVAALLNIKRPTIYKMAKSKKLNFRKIGKLWRIKREDVTNLFENKEPS